MNEVEIANLGVSNAEEKRDQAAANPDNIDLLNEMIQAVNSHLMNEVQPAADAAEAAMNGAMKIYDPSFLNSSKEIQTAKETLMGLKTMCADALQTHTILFQDT